MAIKITADSILKTIKPERHQFTVKELDALVSGSAEPLRVSTVWVMYNEQAEKTEPLNKVASFFFNMPMHGTVLIIPPQQLPSAWDVMEPNDFLYTSDQIEAGFILTLQSALSQFRGTNGNIKNVNVCKEEWVYKPSDVIDEETKDFFIKSYNSIVNTDPNTELLFEDEYNIVKTLSIADKQKTIQQMIDFFVDIEEYEKCSKLMEIKETA